MHKILMQSSSPCLQHDVNSNRKKSLEVLKKSNIAITNSRYYIYIKISNNIFDLCF